MHLEEQSLDEIMANSELLVSCYYIIESAVSYMASDRFGQPLINAAQYYFVEGREHCYQGYISGVFASLRYQHYCSFSVGGWDVVFVQHDVYGFGYGCG